MPSTSRRREPADGWSSGTVRFRLPRKFRNGLGLAAVVSTVGVTLLTVRASHSAAALTKYYTDYHARGGPFTAPGSLQKAADRDKILFVIALLFAVAVWGLVLVVWALRRARLRLDADGLWWSPDFGLRWHGPVEPGDVVALQPGARKRAVPLWIPFTAAANRVAGQLGIYDVTLLYLRSDAGLKMKYARYLVLPQPPPEAANSLIMVPEALFRTNPEFLRTLHSWILS